jgi:hypothetical protein
VLLLHGSGPFMDDIPGHFITRVGGLDKTLLAMVATWSVH